MEKSFFKKYLYYIVGLLIISGFFWTGYKGSQEIEGPIEGPKEQALKEEEQVLVITSARSSSYPFNIIEGEIVSASDQNSNLDRVEWYDGSTNFMTDTGFEDYLIDVDNEDFAGKLLEKSLKPMESGRIRAERKIQWLISEANIDLIKETI